MMEANRQHIVNNGWYHRVARTRVNCVIKRVPSRDIIAPKTDEGTGTRSSLHINDNDIP